MAIERALRALRKRHRLEEGAHGPAIQALAQPFLAQGLEWKEKAESLELELQQCYKAQSRLSEQLVVEVADSRASKALAQEKEALITNLQSEMAETRAESAQLRESLDEKTKALELLIEENQSLKKQLEELTQKLIKLEKENKHFVDTLMLEKMKNAETMNEMNALFQDMMQKHGVSSIEELARQQVDGVIRQSEGGFDSSVESMIPSIVNHTIQAHEGGCGSILFQHNSNKLISGGQDQTVRIWDTRAGAQTTTLNGCIGSVLDLAVTPDNKSVIAASASNKLFVWDMGTSRIRHTLTGHTNKVCAVDANRVSSRHVVSGSYDHTIKVWDLHNGYCNHTIMSASNCNALSCSVDGVTIFSGHIDGNLRVWDSQTGKLTAEVAGHSQAITSVCVSRNGNIILTSGKDNVHNLFDARSLEVCGTFWANGNKVATTWSRSCLSADENYVAAGSADGAIYLWSRFKQGRVSVLEGGHSVPVLSCSWSGTGKPFASADRSGNLCIWT